MMGLYDGSMMRLSTYVSCRNVNGATLVPQAVPWRSLVLMLGHARGTYMWVRTTHGRAILREHISTCR